MQVKYSMHFIVEQPEEEEEAVPPARASPRVNFGARA